MFSAENARIAVHFQNARHAPYRKIWPDPYFCKTAYLILLQIFKEFLGSQQAPIMTHNVQQIEIHCQTETHRIIEPFLKIHQFRLTQIRFCVKRERKLS
jgi:hypothetical protein